MLPNLLGVSRSAFCKPHVACCWWANEMRCKTTRRSFKYITISAVSSTDRLQIVLWWWKVNDKVFLWWTSRLIVINHRADSLSMTKQTYRDSDWSSQWPSHTLSMFQLTDCKKEAKMNYHLVRVHLNCLRILFPDYRVKRKALRMPRQPSTTYLQNDWLCDVKNSKARHRNRLWLRIALQKFQLRIFTRLIRAATHQQSRFNLFTSRVKTLDGIRLIMLIMTFECWWTADALRQTARERAIRKPKDNQKYALCINDVVGLQARTFWFYYCTKV